MLAALKNLSRTLAVMLIIAAAFLVYWPALRNGFVWDDTALVLRDPLIRSSALIGESFRHFLFLDATASNFYRPIQRLSFLADYQFFGFARPGGWHFTSILVHAGAAVALFFALENLLALAAAARLGENARRGCALGVAVLWAIHPLHTSAVTYIAGRADPLAALFGFTGLALGLASLDQNRRVRLWQLGAAAGFALALLSKESGATFLLIWVLVLLWHRVTGRTLATWAAILVMVVGGYCALRFTASKIPPPPSPPTPVAIRPILAARALAEYASLVVTPKTLRMERDVSTHPRDTFEATMQNARLREYQTLAGVLILISLVAWAWQCRRKEPVATLCLGAFALAYLPISNVFPLNATVAEHWLYVPSAFLFAAAVITLIGGVDFAKHRRWRLALIVLGTIWVGYLAARTFHRQEDWRDQRTFIERTIAGGGNSPRMLMNLANVELAAGQSERALELYREAVRRAPDQPIIALGFAHALLRARDFAGARQALARAETSPLLRADCLQFRAALEQLETGADTGDLLRQAVETAPANWPLRKRHIEYLIERGDLAAARGELVPFLEKHPFRAESWKMLGQLLEKTGAPAPARAAYREAMLRDVRDAESRAAEQRLPAEGG